VSGILLERLKARITGEWLEAAALGLSRHCSGTSSRYFSAEGSAVTLRRVRSSRGWCCSVMGDRSSREWCCSREGCRGSKGRCCVLEEG
jgi:hypothetical protein